MTRSYHFRWSRRCPSNGRGSPAATAHSSSRISSLVARPPAGGAACYAASPVLPLPRQLHFEERHQQLPPVLDRTHDSVDFEAVFAVVHLKLTVTAAALEQEPRISLSLPLAVKSPYGEVAVRATLSKQSVHSALGPQNRFVWAAAPTFWAKAPSASASSVDVWSVGAIPVPTCLPVGTHPQALQFVGVLPGH